MKIIHVTMLEGESAYTRRTVSFAINMAYVLEMQEHGRQTIVITEEKRYTIPFSLDEVLRAVKRDELVSRLQEGIVL